ncbi:DNA repair protein RecN [bacterium]|nr:MAG: DNA repair protein RecN [bacterium]
MIVELTVENLAIIDRAQVGLGPGFTVLTGETGAGKSLMIDAIELALGERAATELVRAGSPKATVNVVIDVSDAPAVRAQCDDLGIPVEDNLLYIQREVLAEGRSTCRVGGRMTPVAGLRALGRALVDLHGQHDHQALLDPEGHVAYLDAWIGEPAVRLRQNVAEKYGVAEGARRALADLRKGLRDREQRVDLLKFQVNEIETANPQAGETETLEAQLSRLKNTERLAEASLGALNALTEQEGCAVDLLGDAVKSLEGILRYDASLEEVIKPLQEALYALEEGAHSLRGYTEELDADPATLDEVQHRLDVLKRLRRKYGENEEAVLEHLAAAQEELGQLEDAEASEDKLLQRVEKADRALEKAAAELTAIRKEKAKEFGVLVETQLRDLAMAKAQFAVDIKPRPADAHGADQVEFIFQANAGEPMRPLAKIASGGEISRVMLAMKTALAGRAGVPTLIFDEVDAGLGGRAAATMARKLEELAGHYQLVVISHLPQIAARAATHYRIEKGEVDGRVVTRVVRLNNEQRVEEIARMLAGEKLTEASLANAREMLA